MSSLGVKPDVCLLVMNSAGLSDSDQLTKHHSELLGAITEIIDSLHHILGCRWGWVLKCCCFGGENYLFKLVTHEVAVVGNLVSDVLSFGLA